MKKAIFYFILTFFSLPVLLAQGPAWVVEESNYQFTMTFVAKLNVNGKQLIGANDKVAAFVGEICRGTSGITYIPSEASYYAYLTVFSNTQDEVMYFKLYDSLTDKITNVSKPFSFNVNEHKGNLFQSYSIAEPSLNNKSDLITFDFKEIQSLSSVTNDNNLSISLYDSYDITKLKPLFSISPGAKLFKNKIEQKSGEITDDFSTAIDYEVMSEDESSLSKYTVTVQKIVSPTLFYKKDAVCSVGGVIKVVSSQEGTTVTISSNSKTISSQKIINGEAIFSNLADNSYIVTVGNEWKLINIILKEN